MLTKTASDRGLPPSNRLLFAVSEISNLKFEISSPLIRISAIRTFVFPSAPC